MDVDEAEVERLRQVERIAAGTAELGRTLARMAVHMGSAADSALDIANSRSRQRFYRCPGCGACGTPLPVLSGDVA